MCADLRKLGHLCVGGEGGWVPVLTGGRGRSGRAAGGEEAPSS